MYVVMNQLHVPVEGRENVANRFANSGEKMKGINGCLDFMFLHPEDESHYPVVLTKWESKEDYLAWIHSDEFVNSHKQRRDNLDKSPTQSNEIFAYEVKHSI
ncbi:antibiotic biosynthesis monooxygenase [Paenalkalicoccus suaedae]|uniref:Antibiotic biosynthesis monooxygenase n=1 Tax=Paenalkalicoccus suaedae TaxID=2592382 RepID=A0A859FCW6_9BACI|nr:antibiotic biosynthesis monooxygenase [Paenalkalicoccus suaedae]QKS70641.1 antibiotic biosynthesis monooxygenase [Paenalkalicoccus suaedae]